MRGVFSHTLDETLHDASALQAVYAGRVFQYSMAKILWDPSALQAVYLWKTGRHMGVNIIEGNETKLRLFGSSGSCLKSR
mmetsp:Transcript_14804/g.26755  ORF Transcript_14804/g.26755 Transcript_14804/m.26755 type:complete len:80 (+) Transcript_14804:1740-1979(+)